MRGPGHNLIPPASRDADHGARRSGGRSSVTEDDSRAEVQAEEIAWDYVAIAYDIETAEAVEAELLEDDLWRWLATSSSRAEDMETYRALNLTEDDLEHDELRGHLERAHGHLISARDRRRDELLQELLEEYDPDDVFDLE